METKLKCKSVNPEAVQTSVNVYSSILFNWLPLYTSPVTFICLQMLRSVKGTMAAAARNVSTRLDPTTAVVWWATNCMAGKMILLAVCTYYILTFTQDY